jgi:hypothetical protein
MSEGDAEKIAFIICPLGDPGSVERKRSDQILKHVITPVVKELGYKLDRADKISEPGRITSQIINRLIEVPLVIADLTDRNPNVFYELAIRHAIQKPVILMIEKGQTARIPFDVHDLRAIEIVTSGLDVLDSAELVKNELREQIEFVEKNPSIIESPVSMALLSTELAKGTNVERLLGIILERLEGKARARGAVGNIHINSLRSPSPHVTIKLGDSLSLYFGDVIWSGGQVKLYLSTDGYASISTEDTAYGPTFSVAAIQSPSTTMVYGYSVGNNWINGIIPTTLGVPNGNYYIKAFDGSMAAVATTDNFFTIEST